MEAILKKGINPATGKYDIPASGPKEKLTKQLEIIKSKRPTDDVQPHKVRKLDGLKMDSVVTTSSSSSNTLSSPSISSLDNRIKLNNERSQATDDTREPEKEVQVPMSPTTSQKSFNPAKEEQLEAAMHRFLPVILPKGRMAEKLKASPYNMFLTTVTAAPETHSDPLSITFQELLDPSLGELESSVQFNFMVDVGWLLAQYAFAKCIQQPLLILYGQDMPGLSDINKKRANVTAIKVNIPTPIGCHHTKMMLIFYKDKSLRVVVSTANLYEDDWNNRTQGLWISEKIPALPEGVSYTSHGESTTNFRQDLMLYLIHYNIPKLQPIIARIRESNFSSVKVFFVSSVPGSHRDTGKGIYYGHPRVSTLLSKNCAPIDDSIPIILQASSIGSLGASPNSYLTGEIVSSFKKDSAPIGIRRVPTVKLIYPSLNNVLSSHDGISGGGCLPYDGKTHDKQRWLNDYLYQWKSSSRNRNNAMPHIKSYCRYSDRGLYWFILTSANISRSAWGALNKNNKILNPTLRINSYEAGVAFFPRIILDKDRFPMNEGQRKDSSPIFKLPFDIPPTPFSKDDVPYCAEYLKAYLAKYGAM